jgi:hypothetical protein
MTAIDLAELVDQRMARTDVCESYQGIASAMP